MLSFEYIFDKNYALSLQDIVNFIDINNSWDIYDKMEYGSSEQIPTELFERVGLNLSDLDIKTQVQLFIDIKFMSQFDNNETRRNKFKDYYCSSRLFSHFANSNDQVMCQTAYNAIVQADGWEYFKNFKPDTTEGFMWSSDEKIKFLMNKIVEVDENHSGCSMAFTMRALERIAQTGVV